MTSIKQTVAATAFALSAIVMSGQSADAAPGAAALQAANMTQVQETNIVNVGFKKGGRFRRGGFRKFHRWHHAPYYGHVYYGGYRYRGCYRLKRKAIRTGRPYWWKRYYICRGY